MITAKRRTKQIIKHLLTLALSIWLVVPTVQAQEVIVTLSSTHMTIRNVLREIESQSRYRFAIGHSNFDLSQVAVLSGAQAPVEHVLNEVLKGSGRTYRMDGEQIIIMPQQVTTQEQKQMVVVPFDWSKSYNDTDFLRDAEEDRNRSANATPREPQPTESIEITYVTDSVFRYPARTVLPTDLTQSRWSALSYAGSGENMLAVKINLLHAAAALAPNLGIEVGLGEKTTLDFYGAMNYWNRDGNNNNNKKLIHYVLRPEFRYWLCDRFDGHFFGAHAFYWQYNVSGHKIPLMFDKEFQYEGNAFGAGVSYGYHWMWNKNWGMEFNVGLGVAFMTYDKYECARCGDLEGNYSKTYFGPTSVGIKLVYLIK